MRSASLAIVDTATVKRKRDRWLAWSTYLVVVVAALTSVTVFWARDRGLDLTDEGYYLQLYAHPEAAPPNAAASQYYHLIDILSGPLELGIIGYRIMGLLLLLAAGVVFGLAVYRFVAARLPEYSGAMVPEPVGISLIVLAGLLGYSWAPLTVSYNTLTSVLIQLIVAANLWALSHGAGRGARRSMLFVGLGGAMVPFLFYTKWPAVPAVVVLVALVTFAVLGRDSWLHLAVFGGTALAVFGLVTTGIGAGPFSFADLVDGSGRIATADYSPVSLMLSYVGLFWREVFLVVIEDLPRLVALGVLLTSGPILDSLGKSPRLRWWLQGASAVFLIAEIPRASYLEVLDSFKFVLGVVLTLGLGALAVRTITTRRLPELSFTKWSPRGVMLGAFLVLLVGVALASAVGTNNPLLVSSMHAGGGYGAAIIVGLAAFSSMAGDRSWGRHGIALPVVAVVIAAQVLNGVVIEPYRLSTSRSEQSVALNGIPRLEGIRMDADGARFVTESHRIVTEETGFDSGDRVLAFALLPGLVYSIDGISPGALWILPAETGEQGLICEALRSVPSEVAATTLVIQNSNPSPELAACMTDLIPGYPEAFVEAGRVPIPDGYGAGTGLGTTLRVFELVTS